MKPTMTSSTANPSTTDETDPDHLFPDSEDEGTEDYKKGGYHPIKIGNVFKNRYQVVRKLGWGHFSTVWLCRDARNKGDMVALKVVKSAAHYTEAALDEVEILKTVTIKDPNFQSPVAHLLDNFFHKGPFGTHVCMAFPVLGKNLLALIKAFEHNGIPIHMVKAIAKQMLIGMDFLHSSCQIIHTDLKPENLLLLTPLTETVEYIKRGYRFVRESKTWEIRKPENESEEQKQPVEANVGDKFIVPDCLKIKIVDLGNACWVDKHFTTDIQTRQYRAPEVILGSKYDTTVDLWSVACIIFELATGDFLFEPKSGRNHDKNEDHLAQIMELLEKKIPKSMIQSGKHSKDFFSRTGELRSIHSLRFWPLQQVLTEKYKWSSKDAADMASFLLPMLEINPDGRISARKALQHSWLDGVVL
eukprot:TRINITY_DN1504_c0_g1_i1.p1 TRINITY_DN1504_c0_g1~~TRINITY_DN1504_c0_g1_i1.p1  ORF type:complete len:428 (+),score=133.51 TRINITY_DN1504_c0_g1_i1:38-1285(+)